MCHLPSRILACLGQDQHKFVSAPPRRRIQDSAVGPQDFCEAAERLIANRMAVAIVDLLHVIHVKHEDGKFAPGTLRTLNLLLENTIKPGLSPESSPAGFPFVLHFVNKVAWCTQSVTILMLP